MSRTSKINSRIWNERHFAHLSDRERLAFFFLSTHPHLTALGALRATLPGLAAELGWSLAAFRKAMSGLTGLGLVKFSVSDPLVWLPDYLRDNRPESPNVVKSWEGLLDELPDCELRDELFRRVCDMVEGLGEGFRQALPQAFRVAAPVSTPVVEPEPPLIQPTKPEPQIVLPAETAAVSVTEISEPIADHSRPVSVQNLLRNRDFKLAWNCWLSHLWKTKRTLNPDQREQQLQMLQEWGTHPSIAAINQAITRGDGVLRRQDATSELAAAG